MHSRSGLLILILAGLCFSTGCHGPKKPEPRAPRMEVRKMTGNTVTFIPALGQLPYCLIFTHSERGVTRALTMAANRLSVPCSAGEPVMGNRFRIPLQDGPVKIYTVFSDEKLKGSQVAEQLLDRVNAPRVGGMDMSLPGQVVVDVEEFMPNEEQAPLTGEPLGEESAAGGLRTAARGDAGAL